MSSPTVVIVGGGVIGLSTAYHLARKRYGRIILLDKGPVGDGSSSRAAGIITGLLWSEPGIRARSKSLELYRELSDELEGYDFQATGCLNLFDPHTWPERERLLPLYERLQAPFEILDAAEMRHRWPALSPREEYIGLFDPLGGYSEPHEYIPALAARCREMGVEIREHQKVSGFLSDNGRISGVQTAAGDIAADAIVCTVYSWTLRLMEPLGLQLPVKAFVHQRYVSAPLPQPVNIPAINANMLDGYVRPAAGNRLLGGIESSAREEYRLPSTDFHMATVTAPPELKDRLRSDLEPLVPVLREVAWESEKVGLLTFASDGEPILGPVERLPGLFVGVAFHSGGFAYNPVAGLLMAEYVADGRTSIDISAFSPNRFEADDVAGYLATTVAQKDAVKRRH